MDSNIILVSIIGTVGTLAAGLGGVYLGNWLQERNIKQQREWLLKDQKQEWQRKRRQDKYDRILGYVEGTLKYISSAKWILRFGNKEQTDELVLQYLKQSAMCMPILHMETPEENNLIDLVKQFSLELEGTKEIIQEGNFNITDKEQSLSKLAGQIKQQIDNLLEKTYD